MSGDIGPNLDATIRYLRDLIRIPSVNPPNGGDGETRAAGYCAEVLTSAGIAAEVLEETPGRGSCFARLPATVAHPEPPLILLSHIDVVPVEAAGWSRDPFGAELIDGVVWGRGAVDMKNMVAMELEVMLSLARAGGERRRDLVFAALADEEAGGSHGAGHWVGARPDLFSAADGRAALAALNEVGGYSMTIGDQRTYTIQVAEKGIIWARLHATGTPGHGSMPHADNAAVKLAAAVTSLAAAARPARVIPTVRAFFDALGLGMAADAAARGDDLAARALLEAQVSDPVLRRSLDAMLRDTVTPTVIHAGTKMNVIPGSGEGEVDVRTLPGTDQAALLAELQAIIGDAATLDAALALPPVEWPADAPIVAVMTDALRRADPDASVAPMMITPGTDAKALATIGIPTYGFAPLRLDADTPFLSLFHAHDERVPVSAIGFGLPVLHEVVERVVRGA